MKEILITGANGFIGSNLCRYFLEKGYRVRGLVRRTSDLHFLQGLDVNLIYGDLGEIEKIKLPLTVDFVIHTASLVSDSAGDKSCEESICRSTVDFVTRIINSGLKIKRFIYISSALVLGYGKLNISEENPGKSAFFLSYTKYKRKTEEYLLKLQKRVGFPVVILRPADVYGPNDRTSSIFILKGIERGAPLVVSHGRWILPFCYVDNLSQAAYLACVTKNIEGRAYTVTNNIDLTWKEFFSFFLKRLNKRQWLYVPVFLPYLVVCVMKLIALVKPSYEPLLTFYRIRRVTSHTSFDISKTIEELNFVPDNDIEKQLNSIVDWYLAEKAAGYVK